MKQKILYIILMITAFLGRGESWAADNWGHLPISDKNITLGNTNFSVGNKDDKILDVQISGIPETISFDYVVTRPALATGRDWYVEVYVNGKWDRIWSVADKKEGSASFEIDASVNLIRFCYSGNYGGYFKNISITERRYLTSDKSSLDFGSLNTNVTSTPQTVTISHCNAGSGVTVTSNNAKFKVSKSSLSTTGADKMGEETITVTYKNNTVGEHSGRITITDPSGVNSPLEISVSATTLTSGLTLVPSETPNYEERTYKRVVLQRTLPKGYSTITLPFTYNIGGVEGGYVAQLALVTHNQQDGYTLYFNKVSDGIMQPNQPYVLYLPIEIANPEWGETAVSSPDAQNIQKAGWTMQANYTPGVSMVGNYGIAGGKLCLGGAGSTINAYTAYFIPPTTQNIRTQVAILDEWGNATFIGEVKDGVLQTEEGIFGLDGVRQNELRKGINIVKTKDGTVRKVLK